jgi:hypothetical protein
MPHDDGQQRSLPEQVAVPHTKPSFQRASILFAASLGSFIGASLLLADIVEKLRNRRFLCQQHTGC